MRNLKSRRFAAAAVAALALASCSGGGSGPSPTGACPAATLPLTPALTPAPAPIAGTGTDIRSWASLNVSSTLSLAGTWAPVDTTDALIPFWGVAKLGATQREGIVMAGWAYSGFSNTATDVTPVRAVLLDQQADGTLLDATATYLPNAVTNGAGSVIVADFNGDGLDDVLLPAHNESPFVAKPSAAFISRSGGGFDKLTLADSVMDHDARLVVLNGVKKVFARSFGGSGNGGNGPGFNLLYSWSGSGFNVDTSLGDLGGMSVTAGNFTGNSDDWLIVGDSIFGPGIPYAPTNPMQTYAYRYAAGSVTTPPILLPKPYFNDKPQYAGFKSLWDPYSKTSTPRLWAVDINKDGLPDILAGATIWDATAGLKKSVFQVLANGCNMNFTDATDSLAPEYSQDSYIDYSVRLVDVDGSGIETMFLAQPAFTPAEDAARQGNYILVNDGTGRLYAAMHDEFRALGAQVISYLQSQLPAGTSLSTGVTPRFLPYRTAAGVLNYVAVAQYSIQVNGQWTGRYAFVNVPLGINLATDFRRDLTIASRNGSRRIRTFAGNDTIARALADPDGTIDGGLGSNTVVYPGKRSAWLLARSGQQVTVRPASGSGGTDTLTRIQWAKFDDQTIDLAGLP